MARKKVVILGSTGSIGVNTLKVIERYPGRFEVVGLTAYSNLTLLEKQIRQFSPNYVGISSRNFLNLKKRLNGKRIKIVDVETGLSEIVSLPQVDIVVIGMTGSAALDPFLSAVRCGKTVAPANKEALVIAGDIIMKEAKKHNAEVIPFDS